MKTLILFIIMVTSIATCHVVDKNKVVYNTLEKKINKIYQVIVEKQYES